MTKCHYVISKLKGQHKVLSPQGHTASEELTSHWILVEMLHLTLRLDLDLNVRGNCLLLPGAGRRNEFQWEQTLPKL